MDATLTTNAEPGGLEFSQIQHRPWQNDYSVTDCPHCQGAFSFLNRKHHCRACGLVVFSQCSKHKSPLPVRVDSLENLDSTLSNNNFFFKDAWVLSACSNVWQVRGKVRLEQFAGCDGGTGETCRREENLVSKIPCTSLGVAEETKEGLSRCRMQ